MAPRRRPTPPRPASPRPALRLRYLWDSQTIIVVAPAGQVLAAAPLARLIVEAPRRKEILPRNDYGYEIAALRDAGAAEAQLAGRPAPAGRAPMIHGKAIHSCNPRDALGLPEAPMPRLPVEGLIEDVDADD